MVKEIKYPSLKRIENSPLLASLEQRANIFRAIANPDDLNRLLPELEHLIFEGCQELIDLFNRTEMNDPALSLPSLVRTKLLKVKVGQLPDLADLNDQREIAFALVNASHRMLDGQTNKKRRQSLHEVSQAETNFAIGTPSMDIPAHTKTVGSVLHFIERAMFVYFRHKFDNPPNNPLSHWTKDEILFALEDMAQLRHTQRRLNQTADQETILFEIINTPNDLGGLGWRKQANLDAMFVELDNLN